MPSLVITLHVMISTRSLKRVGLIICCDRDCPSEEAERKMLDDYRKMKSQGDKCSELDVLLIDR